MREDRNGYGSRKEGLQTAKLRRSCPNVACDLGLTPLKAPPCHGENTARMSLVMTIKSAHYGKQSRVPSSPIWLRTAQFLHYKQKRGSSISSSPAAGAEQIGRVAGAGENPIA